MKFCVLVLLLLLYICVLILLYMCPYTDVYVVLFEVWDDDLSCPHTAIYMCPHTAIYVSSYCYICVHILMYMSCYFRYGMTTFRVKGYTRVWVRCFLGQRSCLAISLQLQHAAERLLSGCRSW
jgi:hypothetical protein